MEWRASHILVKDRALAADLLKRIKQGASFESLAREFSDLSFKVIRWRSWLVWSWQDGSGL